MNSPIPWMGGKSQSRYFILPRFPLFYERYIEVFGGGGWILFAKKPEPFEVYNDFNNNLYNLFNCVKNNAGAFLKQLGYLPVNARREFDVLVKIITEGDSAANINEEREIMQEFGIPNIDQVIALLYGDEVGDSIGDVRRAAAFYKVIRYSYASGCTSYSCQPCNIKSAFHQIIQANKRLNDNGTGAANERVYKKPFDVGNGVILENKDFESIIRQYDRPESFFYCDPPYYQAEGCYAVAFTKDDHYRLKETLSGIQGKFMLSYNDCEFTRELYDGYYMESYSRINSISQRYDAGGLYGELLIANYDMRERARSKPAQITLF